MRWRDERGFSLSIYRRIGVLKNYCFSLIFSLSEITTRIFYDFCLVFVQLCIYTVKFPRTQFYIREKIFSKTDFKSILNSFQ